MVSTSRNPTVSCFRRHVIVVQGNLHKLQVPPPSWSRVDVAPSKETVRAPAVKDERIPQRCGQSGTDMGQTEAARRG